MARRAQPRRKHALVNHASLDQHVARRRPSVEEPVVCPTGGRQSRHRWISGPDLRGLEKPSSHLIGSKTGCLELATKVEANFVAAGPNRRAERDQQVVGPAAELTRHRVHDSRWNACRHATPSCVRGGDCTGTTVGDKQRHAIGGLNGQAEIRSVGYDDVGVRARGSFRCIRGDEHRATVDLSRPDERRSIELEAGSHLGPRFIVASGHADAEPPAARGKKMRRDVREGRADERRTAGAMGPRERFSRLRKI